VGNCCVCGQSAGFKLKCVEKACGYWGHPSCIRLGDMDLRADLREFMISDDILVSTVSGRSFPGFAKGEALISIQSRSFLRRKTNSRSEINSPCHDDNYNIIWEFRCAAHNIYPLLKLKKKV
jgi:hypothetical protein